MSNNKTHKAQTKNPFFSKENAKIDDGDRLTPNGTNTYIVRADSLTHALNILKYRYIVDEMSEPIYTVFDGWFVEFDGLNAKYDSYIPKAHWTKKQTENISITNLARKSRQINRKRDAIDKIVEDAKSNAKLLDINVTKELVAFIIQKTGVSPSVFKRSYVHLIRTHYREFEKC